MSARLVLVFALVARVAFADGIASPDKLVASYRQLAASAAAHGQREVAERYYRRWLALEPSAQLPDTARPAEREAFVAAQIYMSARSPLTARADVHAHQIEVVVVSDPLVMVAAVSIDGVRHELPADRRVRAAASARRAAVALLDDQGNHLLELEATDPDMPAPGDLLSPQDIPQRAPERPRTALAREPVAWLVPAAAFALTGATFAVEAKLQQNQLDDIVAHSPQHFFSDAATVQDRRDRYVRIAEVGFAAGGACAVTAAVMWWLKPERVKPAPGGVAIAF